MLDAVLPAPRADLAAARLLEDVSLAFAPGSYDAAAGEVDVVWSTGADVVRRDGWSGERFLESLDLAGADLARLNAGAPLLLDHAASIRNVVGSVVPGSARVEGRAGGIARVRFDRSSPEGQAAEAKVAGGHVRFVSVGYRVGQWEERAGAKGELPRWIARAWEPFEISLVAVPADRGAGTRAAPITPLRGAAAAPATQEVSMPTLADAPEAQPTTRTAAPDVAQAERRRGKDIRERVRALGMAEALADELVESGASPEQVNARLVDAMAARTRQAPAAPSVGMGRSYDDPAVVHDAMTEALAARMLGRAPAGAGERYRGWPVHELVREELERAGTRTQGWAPHRLMDAALTRGGMHTTSDFPIVLGNAVNRTLAENYARAQSPIRKSLCRERDVSDFRDITVARTANFPTLEKIGEAGEVRHGTIDERGEVYRVETFAKGLAISRQALVNDDLGAFAQAARSAAVAAAETEAGVLVALLTQASGAGPTLRDGTPLFATTRPTLASSGSAITSASLSIGRAAMRGQMDIGGGGPIGLGPKFLLVSPAKETEAEQLVAAVTPHTPGEVNPFAGRLVPLVEARLSGNAWFLFADPLDAAVLEVAYLGGSRVPEVRTFEQVNHLGITLRVVLDFGAGVIGWRGAWRNPGA
jgi:hypothetical protein